MSELKTKIILRNDSTENWNTYKDKVLLKGEVGLEALSDGKTKMKVGDGVTPWKDLPYVAGEGASDIVVYQVVPQGSETDIQAITRVVGSNVLNHGDQAVVIRNIGTGDVTPKSYTAYVYAAEGQTSVWKAMDGNYRADNVYFDEDLTATYPIGKYTIPSTGSTVIPAEGKNLKSVLSDIIAEEKQPTVTNPTAKFVSYTGISNSTVEPGTPKTGTVSYKLGLATVGSYTYGPDVTGVSATGYSLKYQIGDSSVSPAITTETGSFDYDLVVGTSNIVIKTVEATVSHSAATSYAKTNIGTVTDKRVEEGTVTCGTKTNTFTSSRKSFWSVDNNIGQELTNMNIRSLTNNEFGTKVSYSLTIPLGTKRVIVAVPGSKTMKSCIDVDGMGLDVKENFTVSTVTVGGYDSTEESIGDYGTSYSVFVYENGAGLSATTYNITLQ